MSKRKINEDEELLSESDDNIEDFSGGETESDSDELSDNLEIDDEDHDFDDKCPFRYADESDYEEEDLGDDDDEEDIEEDIIEQDERITKPFLTSYERVRLLSDRTTELAKGAQPKIKNVEGLSVEQIAELELKNKIMPLKVRRPIPNKKDEIWDLSELIY